MVSDNSFTIGFTVGLLSGLRLALILGCVF
jgi:hypothetical protein